MRFDDYAFRPEKEVDPFGLIQNQPIFEFGDHDFHQPILAVQRTNQPGVKTAHWTVSSCIQSYSPTRKLYKA